MLGALYSRHTHSSFDRTRQNSRFHRGTTRLNGFTEWPKSQCTSVQRNRIGLSYREFNVEIKVALIRCESIYMTMYRLYVNGRAHTRLRSIPKCDSGICFPDAASVQHRDVLFIRGRTAWKSANRAECRASYNQRCVATHRATFRVPQRNPVRYQTGNPVSIDRSLIVN